MLARRSKSTDWVQRLAIALNPSCPPNILATLKKDGHRVVASGAQANEAERLAAVNRHREMLTGPSEPLALGEMAAEVASRLKRECKTWMLLGTPWFQCLSLSQRLGRFDGELLAETFQSCPDTHLALLDGLCQDEEMCIAVAGSAATPQSLLRALAKHERVEVRCAVAGNPSAPADLLQSLAKSRQYLVRQALGANRSARSTLLRDLAGSTDVHVSGSVACDPSAPPEMVDAFLREGLGSLYWRVGFSKGPTQSAAISRALMRTLAGRQSSPIRHDTALTPALLLVALLQHLAQSKDAVIRRQVAGNPYTPAALVESLAGDAHEDVFRTAARNPVVAPALLESLATDPRVGMRLSVALNPSTPAEALDSLSRDKVDGVRDAAASNPSTAPATLELLAASCGPHGSSKRSLVWAIAGNPSTPLNVLGRLAGFTRVLLAKGQSSMNGRSRLHADVLSRKARLPTTTAVELEAIAHAGYWVAGLEAIRNKNYPSHDRASALEGIRSQVHVAVRQAASDATERSWTVDDFRLGFEALELLPDVADKNGTRCLREIP